MLLAVSIIVAIFNTYRVKCYCVPMIGPGGNCPTPKPTKNPTYRPCSPYIMQDINYDVDECEISAIAQRENGDIKSAVQDVLMSHLVGNGVGNIPIIGPWASAALDVGVDLFEAATGDENGLVNGIIDDINERTDSILKCMDEKITSVITDDIEVMMEDASEYYHVAASYHVNEDLSNAETKRIKLYMAWMEFKTLANNRFSLNEDNPQYYKDLVVPLQNFVRAFELVSIDYLTYVHVLDNEINYETHFDLTIDAVNSLQEWTETAKDMILDGQIRPRIMDYPCIGGTAVREELITEWENQFDTDHVQPILQFMNDLQRLDDILTGRWRPIAKEDIASTISSNVDVNSYNDADGHLVFEGILLARGCGSGDKIYFGSFFETSNALNEYWTKIRYTMEFASGASSCWSMLGNNGNLANVDYGLRTEFHVIDNELKYGNWDGETKRCDNEKDNFFHAKHGQGYKGYLTVEQERDFSVGDAGIGSRFSCNKVPSVVRYRDIYVYY